MADSNSSRLLSDTGKIIEHRGVSYRVFLNTSTMRFTVTVGDHELEAASYQELLAKAERVPRVKVSVPFTRDGGADGVKHYTATGFHADGKHLLARKPGSTRPEQFADYATGGVMRTLSPEEEDELVTLHAQLENTSVKIKEFVQDHHMDIFEETRQALRRAGAEASDA